MEGRYRSARLLLELGLDPRRGGGPFGSCLHLAVAKLNTEFTLRLLNYGNIAAESWDMDKNTPLHILFSIFSKNSQVAQQLAEALLKSGVRPNELNKDNWTALHLAVKKN